MNKLLYFSDGELQSQLATKYNLLVHVGVTSFEYAIIDTVRDEVKVMAEWELPEHDSITTVIEHIKALPESTREFRFIFNKVKISVDTVYHTLVPADLFGDSQLQDFGKYWNLADSSELLINDLCAGGVKNIIAIESALIAALGAIFQNPRIYSSSTTFIQGMYKTPPAGKDTTCFIDVKKKHFKIGVMSDRRPAFYNSFDYSHNDDFNYFLLSVIDSLDLKPADMNVILSGKIVKGDEIYTLINKYFDDISMSNNSDGVRYPETFQEIPPHTYFSLMNLDLCE